MSETCKNTRKLLRVGGATKDGSCPNARACVPKVDDHYVLRDSGGSFLAASGFPKNRETRSPYLDELLPHQNEIDSKYQYLMRGLQQTRTTDTNKFSTKTKEQYLVSEKNMGSLPVGELTL